MQKAIDAIEIFKGSSLTKSLAAIENEVIGSNSFESVVFVLSTV